jgi:hypothetical protein
MSPLRDAVGATVSLIDEDTVCELRRSPRIAQSDHDSSGLNIVPRSHCRAFVPSYRAAA